MAKKSKIDVAPKLTALMLEVACASKFNYRQNLIIPNASWGLGIHECDLLVVSKSGYCTEIEIKISKQDLIRDFAKPHGHKHELIRSMYYCVPEELREVALEIVPKDKGVLVCYRSKTYKDHFTNIVTARNASIRKDARKLTPSEREKAFHLAAMRLWTLKETRLKNELSIGMLRAKCEILSDEIKKLQKSIA